MTSSRQDVVAFIDLQAQRKRLGTKIDEAIDRVLNHGKFIMGPEVTELEGRLADFSGVRHCVSCASGTDALLMALMAWSVGPGSAVFVPSFTFASTAEVVVLLGATPVFVDVLPDTFNIDPDSLASAVEATKQKHSLRPKVVIAVDMFGLPAAYKVIADVAARFDLKVLADAAQSYGGSTGGKRTGSLGDVATTSFFPAKPLGCYGDGGAIFTDDEETAAVLRSIRVHGQGSDKYDNVRIGINGRLDTLQAAILIEKLEILQDEIERRNVVAERYEKGLGSAVRTPSVSPDASSAWAQYTIVCGARDDVRAKLRRRGIPTAIYYPKPLHLQTAYRSFPIAPAGVPVCEELSNQVLSLPMHPYMEPDTQERVVTELAEAVTRSQ